MTHSAYASLDPNAAEAIAREEAMLTIRMKYDPHAPTTLYAGVHRAPPSPSAAQVSKRITTPTINDQLGFPSTVFDLEALSNDSSSARMFSHQSPEFKMLARQPHMGYATPINQYKQG